MTNFSELGNLYYKGLLINHQPDAGLVCLSDIWKAERTSENKKPSHWINLESTQMLIKGLIEQTGFVSGEQIMTEIPGILATDKLGGEIYATTEVAVVYAKFLSVECYEWALANLVEGSEEEAYLEHVEERTQAKRQREFSRRALIAAGWAVPVVLSVGLDQKAIAQVTHSDGHNDGHSDTHNDHADAFCDNHTDQSHIDFNDHADSPGGGHGDASHLDHNDMGHIDAPHFDTPNIPHGDSPNGGHGDGPHTDHLDCP